MKRKVLTLLICLLVTIPFTACSEKEPTVDTASNKDAVTEKDTESTESESDVQNAVNETEEPRREIEIEELNDSDIITFKDECFKTKIEEITGITDRDITYADVKYIETLEFSFEDGNLSDLTALKYFSSLKHLKLYGVTEDVTNLDPLVYCKELSVFEINNYCNISDLFGLSGCENLTRVSMIRNDHSDNYNLKSLDGIENLHNLTEFSISNAGALTDISALEALTNLTYLIIRSDVLEDISVLEGLTNLTYLDISSDLLTDVSALSNLSNLVYLNIDSDSLTDTSALENLTNTDITIE